MKTSLLLFIALIGFSSSIKIDTPSPSDICPRVEQVWEQYCNNTAQAPPFCNFIPFLYKF